MSYKSILICLESEKTVNSLVEMACNLANGQPAHIFGVHVLPGPDNYISVSPYIPLITLSSLAKQYAEHAVSIRNKFEQVMRIVPSEISWEWSEQGGLHLGDYTAYVEHALISDVVVVGQRGITFEGEGIAHAMLTQAGTPVILVPKKKIVSEFARKICVAWNETPESARAVKDALPLLHRAERVQVIWVGNEQNDRVTHGADVARYLSRHGIQAIVHNVERVSRHPGADLLQFIQENNSDLLVMGGYGHSAIYNTFFGAVTPHVVKNMEIPVFLSQ